jgi:dTDP-4-dehydrorhamnose 3,5-epimerase
MEVIETNLPGVLLIKPRVFGDPRGFFVETWSAERYTRAGVPGPFVQDNLSRSGRGVLRGMHLQNPFGQGKLVSVPMGEVFDVCVDARPGSPTFGKWFSCVLSGENQHQLYIPAGFAHGFCVLRDATLFSYKCTQPYHPEAELGILWNDPDIGITWPLGDPLISERDLRHPRLRDIEEARLPPWR